MIESKPQFLNGVYSFASAGYEKVAPLDEKLVYVVPSDRCAPGTRVKR